MIDKWISSTWSEVGMVLFSTVVVYAAITIYTRVVGLRSFSKMSATDFAMTVAVGSLFGASISSPSPTLTLALASIGFLYVGQWMIALLRRKFNFVSKVIDNQPLLLMSGSTFVDENLRRSNVTRADVFAKLREANALNYDEILAVIFESTGDISVLHSSDNNVRLEPDFLEGVSGSERIEF